MSQKYGIAGGMAVDGWWTLADRAAGARRRWGGARSALVGGERGERSGAEDARGDDHDRTSASALTTVGAKNEARLA